MEEFSIYDKLNPWTGDRSVLEDGDSATTEIITKMIVASVFGPIAYLVAVGISKAINHNATKHNRNSSSNSNRARVR